MRGIPNFVQSLIEFKFWLAQPPPVGEARPTHCPCCGIASRPVGMPLQLHGHGARQRQLRGPAAPWARPSLVLCWVRRYLCQTCGQGCTVGPSDIAPRKLFSACAIALALGLWGLAGLPAREVRRQVSPWSVVGINAHSTWRSLRRWARAVRDQQLFKVRRTPEAFSLRQIAARAASTLAARGRIQSLPLPQLAFFGALAP